MAHTLRVCEGCGEDIHKYDDYTELDYGMFYHWRCRHLWYDGDE